METFSLLKYWKGSNGTPAAPTPPSPAAEDTTAIPQNDVETTDDEDDNNEDGPFFDLEFTVPDEEPNEDSEDAHENLNDDDNNEDEPEREFNFTLSPSTNDDRSSSDPNLSEDLFFKGKLVQLENDSSEPNSKPQFTASLLKSATKFRVFMLGLKKSKPNVVVSDKDSNSSDSAAQKPNQQGSEPQQKKLFTVKFKVEEVPIVSMFTRDNSSKGGTANKASQKQKQQQQQNAEESELRLQSHSSASDEKQRFSKEVMQKYLKKVKPLYVRVSRRYAEKLRFSGQLSMPPPPQPQKPAPEEKAQTEADGSENGGSKVKGEKQGNLPLPAGLRVVCKHLGKSRSASSSVASPTAESVSSRRRDDSLVQQHDGIQSAILHCKKSFNASRECESSSHLPRPVSNPLHELSPESSSKSTNDVENEGLFEM